MQTIHEEARDLPVFEATDVLVAGGGLSGCAAALAAARAGARTALLERDGCLGGVATATLMANIGNRMTLVSGERVVQGIAGEIVDRLVACGGASPAWRKHNGICMDSERLKVILIELLDEAGVLTLTHCLAARPIAQGRAIQGCFFESKSGRQAILARNTVDCTGEADLAWQAGAECRTHRASSSLLFKLRDVDVDRFVRFLGEDPDGFPSGMDWVRDYADHLDRWQSDGVFFFPHHGGKKWRWLRELMRSHPYGELRGKRPWWGDIENIEAFGMYSHRRDGTVVVNTGYFCFDQIEARTLAHGETLAQRFCYYAADYMIKHFPGFEKARVEHVGVSLGLRGGRYIVGRSRLKTEELKGSPQDVHRDDVIATAPVVPLDPGSRPGAIGTTCDIPFGSCVPVNLSRLLVGSGKSVDAEGGNSRIYRGMSGCMVYGQACGAAAALAAKRGIGAEQLPVRDLQSELLRQGVRLGRAERLCDLGLSASKERAT